MTNNETIAALKANLPNIGSGQKEFASSLINQFATKGALSDKQWFH